MNLEFLKQNFTTDEINLLPRISSWAINQRVKERKRKVGFKVKRIIDYGRMLYLRDTFGMKVHAY